MRVVFMFSLYGCVYKECFVQFKKKKQNWFSDSKCLSSFKLDNLLQDSPSHTGCITIKQCHYGFLYLKLFSLIFCCCCCCCEAHCGWFEQNSTMLYFLAKYFNSVDSQLLLLRFCLIIFTLEFLFTLGIFSYLKNNLDLFFDEFKKEIPQSH